MKALIAALVLSAAIILTPITQAAMVAGAGHDGDGSWLICECVVGGGHTYCICLVIT